MREIDLMTEDRPRPTPNLPNPGRLEERPAWLMLAVLAWIALMVAGMLVLPYASSLVDPEPSPSYQPDECTAEYVETNGICLTWEDYHGGQSTYR